MKENPKAQLRAAAGDLSKANGVDAVARETPDVDILVNSLGGYEAKPFFDISDADWQSMWEKNVMSGVRLSRQYMRGMLARNWGRVIFISSEAALTLSSAMLHYGVTKTAVLALSRGLADLTVGTAVTVNAVLPGPTRTEDTVAWMSSVAKEKGISVAEAEKAYFETRSGVDHSAIRRAVGDCIARRVHREPVVGGHERRITARGRRDRAQHRLTFPKRYGSVNHRSRGRSILRARELHIALHHRLRKVHDAHDRSLHGTRRDGRRDRPECLLH